MAALGGDAPTVVWVRVGNTRSAALLDWFEPLIDEVVSLVEAGNRLIELARLRPNLLGSPLPLPVAWLRSVSFRRAAVVGPPENPSRRRTLDVASRNMALGTLIKGLALLLLLLITAGQLGNLGPVELLIWLALVVAWIIWWVTRRARARATP